MKLKQSRPKHQRFGVNAASLLLLVEWHHWFTMSVLLTTTIDSLTVWPTERSVSGCTATNRVPDGTSTAKHHASNTEMANKLTDRDERQLSTLKRECLYIYSCVPSLQCQWRLCFCHYMQRKWDAIRQLGVVMDRLDEGWQCGSWQEGSSALNRSRRCQLVGQNQQAPFASQAKKEIKKVANTALSVPDERDTSHTFTASVYYEANEIPGQS